MITSCLFCEKLLISADIICIIEIQLIDLGGIAQLVERLNGIQEVRGSTPLISTSSNLKRTSFARTVLGFFVFNDEY